MDTQQSNLRAVQYRHTSNLPGILGELGCSLLVSTYQAGKLLTIGTTEKGLHFSFHNFDRAMGVAASPRRMALGAKGRIWFHEVKDDIARRLPPAGQFDRCYLARSAMVTGSIHCHEIVWDRDDELWVVNTLFSCLATLHPQYNFVPRWRPPFISELTGEDRCHLNGLAMRDGVPAYVTMMAETNEAAAWRPLKKSSGIVMDISSQEVVARGMAMPHSPRWSEGNLWVLNSGQGSLETVELATGARTVIEKFPGYTRGLAFCGSYAFVGLSRIRETAVFGDVPIAANPEGLKCGVGVVDLSSGRTIATLEFESGVEEIFDVQVLSNTLCPAICGPQPDQDGAQDIWVVPRPDQVEALTSSDTSHSRKVDRQTLFEQARQLQSRQRVREAIPLLEQAARQPPPSAIVLNHLGNAYQDIGEQLSALECYRQAARVDLTYAPALQNLGYLLIAHGRTDEGVEQLRRADAAEPSGVNQVLIATALPTIYESMADLRERRLQLTARIAELAASSLRIDTTNTLVPTSFFTAYQGENDRELNRHLGQIYQGPDLTSGWKARASREKIRIGFLSAYFRDHTIGRLNIGRIERFPSDDFEKVIFSIGRYEDPLTERFRQAADQYIVLPRELSKARQMIADKHLDVLLFAEVGMDALTYTLAFSRMAPIQISTWGHPVTTGSSKMDYFLSSELLDTPDAEAHYTERVLRLRSLGTYYYRPLISDPIKQRADFSLPEKSHLYLCPQTLFKIHPEFDELLAEILRRDPHGELVMIEGRTKHWTRLLQERFSRTVSESVERIRWLPPLANQDYLQLLRLGDVMLDPLHFGGGNTSYESFAVGTPVVTLPGPFLRSRITQGLYRKMAEYRPLSETPAPVASSKDQYVALACMLAAKGNQRERCREWIERRSLLLFEDDAEVEDLADAIRSLAGVHR